MKLGNRPFNRVGRYVRKFTALAALLAMAVTGRLSAQIVHFPDRNLEAALSSQLGVTIGTITTDEMLGLTYFSGGSKSIRDTTGLEIARNLVYLWLDDNHLTNFSGIVPLSKLNTLTLSSCQLTNVSFLSGLTNLTTLDLSWNQALTNTSPLAGLPSLAYLYLSADTSASISALSGLTNLISLSLYYAGVADLSPLIPLTQLQVLDISDDPVTNADVLANLTGLDDLRAEGIGLTNGAFLAQLFAMQYLDLEENQLTNADFLSQLTQLRSLQLDDNQLTSLPNLTGLISLTYLSLNDNQLTNIDAVSGLSSLQNLGLYENQLTSLPNLTGLTSLTYLDLDDNQLTNVDTVANLSSLQNLSLEDNQVSTLPPLASLTFLTSLDLWDNPLTSLAGLAGLTSLNSLYIYNIGSAVTNFDVLAQLTSLNELEAGSSGISDLAPLAGLTNLTQLYLSWNDVGDVGPLAGLTNLTYLDLSGNVLTSMDALTNLISGRLNVNYNFIDFSPGTQAADDLQFLQDESITVYYNQQNSPLPQFGIVSQPTDLTVAAGATASFSVTATSSVPNLQYQWQFQDTDLAGQNSSILTLPGVTAGQAGRYRVRVTDGSWQHLWSQSAQLVVQGGGQPTAPDLTVTGAVGVSPNPINAGNTLAVSYTALNQGDGDAPMSHTLIQVNLGSSVVNTVEVVHSTPAISADSSITENVMVPIPQATPAGAYTVYVTLDYDHAIGQSNTSNDNAQTAIGALTVQPPLTFAQAVNAPNLTFTTGGDAPWFVEYTNTYNGAAAALQSGHIGNNQSSWISTTVTGPGVISFWWTVDSDNGDVLGFGGYGPESIGIATWGGEWSYESFEIPAGPTTLSWDYWKDASGSYGADAGWLDNVTYTPYLPVVSIAPEQWKYLGASCTITSSVSGASIDSFQWYLNGAPVSGGTINGYGPFTASCANAGIYSLVTSNSHGTVTNSAKLVVAPIFYQITDLGTLWTGSGVYNWGNGLNNFNDVVGVCYWSGDGYLSHPWVWSGGVMHDLGEPLGGTDDNAFAINDQGDIVGTAEVAGTTNYDAVRWRKSGGGYTVNDLGRNGWPFAAAQAINDAGDIAFSVTDVNNFGWMESGNRRAYLWRQNTLLSLGSLVPALNNDVGDAYGWAMNSLGTIVGSAHSSPPAGQNQQGRAWSYNGTWRDNLQSLDSLYSLPASLTNSSGAYAVNDYGDTVGQYDIGQYLYGEYVGQFPPDLSKGSCYFVLSGTNTFAISGEFTESENASAQILYGITINGINNHGDVLVQSNGACLFCSTNVTPRRLADGRPDYSDHAYFNLTDLLPGGNANFNGLNLANSALGYKLLNEARAFIGYGYLPNGEFHAYLATPLPWPGNHPPAFTGTLKVTNNSSTLVFPISAVLAKATDADGDTLALITTTQPASGAATVRRDAGNFIYQANNTTPPASDSFSCIIMDYHGGMATGAVQVVSFPSGLKPQLNRIVMLGKPGSSTFIRFVGTPGQTWRIQASDDLGGGNWTTIATVIVGPDGLIDANDALGVGHPNRLYRAVMP